MQYRGVESFRAFPEAIARAVPCQKEGRIELAQHLEILNRHV